MAENTENSKLFLMPNEILHMILKRIDVRDMARFGLTCKHFYSVIFESEYPWKYKCIKRYPSIYDTIVTYRGGRVLEELKTFYITKYKVETEIHGMSSKYFWRKVSNLSLEDVRIFFEMAVSDNVMYNYIVTILRDMLKVGHDFMEENQSFPPYTLTEMYYAKVTLQHLVENFLAIKWYYYDRRKRFTPGIVLNIHMEFIDPCRLHPQEDADVTIAKLVERVENLFSSEEAEPQDTLLAKVSCGLVKKIEVLQAVSRIIFTHNPETPNVASVNTLDIPQVWHSGGDTRIAVAALYQEVASRCGVHLDLVKECTLLFESPDDPTNRYKIDLGNGEIIAIRPRKSWDGWRFIPDKFFENVLVSYNDSQSGNWTDPNARNLRNFHRTDLLHILINNPCSLYSQNLRTYKNPDTETTPLRPEYLENCYLKMLDHIAKETFIPPPLSTAKTKVKQRRSGVKFAVGMICTMTALDLGGLPDYYSCVIIGWDRQLPANKRHLAYHIQNDKQPFYSVVTTMLHGEQYVAEELLDVAFHPTRLSELEDLIAKYFTHFNGVCYVPNDELERLYPKDGRVRASLARMF